MWVLAVAIAAMLIQQTIATTAKVGLPALFPAISGELAIASEFVLLYTWAYAVCSLLVMAGCGGLIRRFGALRTSQIGCFTMAAGLAGAALFTSPVLVVMALGVTVVLVSFGSTVATPASSQILARFAPRRWAPLIFSVKQTGVPAGVVIAGLILAPLAVAWGWRLTLAGLALLCVTIAILLQPLRREFDRDRDPRARPRLADFFVSIRDVLIEPERRALAMATFTFVGMQAIYTNFSITYLYEDLQYSLTDAGQVLGLATLLAIPARVFWGWVGSVVMQPRRLLAFLAVAMSVSTALVGGFDPHWSRAAILVVNCAVSLSVLSWHGVLLSEAARLAPAGEAGRMTGAVLAFGAAGQIAYPVIFGAGFWIGGYPVAWAAIAAPACLVGTWLAVRRR